MEDGKGGRMEGREERLLDFFKALANLERLKIVGLLALEKRTIEEISGGLNLKPASVYNDLAMLKEIFLVRVEGNTFELDREALEEMARDVLSDLRPRVTPEDFEGEDYGRKVLSDFFQPDGRLKTIPAQEKKLLVVLGHIAQSFKPGVDYPEAQVNEILLDFHEDSALLRRYLVDYEFMEREGGGGDYWRAEEED
jgi:hypothetical protein